MKHIKIKKLHTLMTILSLFLLSACCKDQNPNVVGCQKNPAQHIRLTLAGADKYLVGKPNSFWIYKNTKTGDLDTQTCKDYLLQESLTSKNIVGENKKAKEIIFTFDRLFYNIYSSYNTWIYQQETNDVYASSKIDLEDRGVVLDRIVANEGLATVFLYPFKEGNGVGNGSSLTLFKQLLPTLTLQGETYNNVAVFEIDQDDIWYANSYLGAIKYPKAKYYWAENVGLIKRENISENYSWELIEYNIIN